MRTRVTAAAVVVLALLTWLVLADINSMSAGHRIELYSCDYYTGDPDHKPLRWSVNDPRCRSFWGARAPDSWYDESSVVLAPDGAVVPVYAAQVDERDQRSEVMA